MSKNRPFFLHWLRHSPVPAAWEGLIRLKWRSNLPTRSWESNILRGLGFGGLLFISYVFWIPGCSLYVRRNCCVTVEGLRWEWEMGHVTVRIQNNKIEHPCRRSTFFELMNSKLILWLEFGTGHTEFLKTLGCFFFFKVSNSTCSTLLLSLAQFSPIWKLNVIILFFLHMLAWMVQNYDFFAN